MSYIKKQSDNETKKLFGINGWNVQKKKGTTISVILKNTKKTAQKYQNTYGNLKITTLIIN